MRTSWGDPRDPAGGNELSDIQLESEIELLADVIDAVGRAGRALSQQETDRVLGVTDP